MYGTVVLAPCVTERMNTRFLFEILSSGVGIFVSCSITSFSLFHSVHSSFNLYHHCILLNI